MNARNQVFNFVLDGRLIFDVVSSLFNTIVFNRSYGKFVYNSEKSFSVSNIGYMDVDCNFLDFTYIACSSKSLHNHIRAEVETFCDLFRNDDTRNLGEISLEFYQKKPNRWAIFQPEIIPWEIWTIRLELLTIIEDEGKRLYSDKVTEILSEKILYITDVINRYDYVPEIPNRSELPLTFDTSYPDVQPYLFKFNYSTSTKSSPSLSTTVTKFLRESLQL